MSATRDRRAGTRLADVRVPRYWPVSVLGALLLARRSGRRDFHAVQRTASELGEVTVERWRATDARADELIRLTERLAQLTWALLLVAAATLIVSIALIASA